MCFNAIRENKILAKICENFRIYSIWEYTGVSRHCLSFSFYEQIKLHFLTNLTEGVVSRTNKILNSLQKHTLNLFHGNSGIEPKRKLDAKILVSFLSNKAKDSPY